MARLAYASILFALMSLKMPANENALATDFSNRVSNCSTRVCEAMTQPIDFIGRLAATQNGDARCMSPLLAHRVISLGHSKLAAIGSKADIEVRGIGAQRVRLYESRP